MSEADQRLQMKSDDGSTEAELAPSLGGLVTRFSARGREVLFLDEASLSSNDPKVSRRGGIPVLFPSPGRLKGDLFEAEGRYGALKNHGFARDLPFTVLGATPSRASLRLEATDRTLAQFPWDFVLEMDVSVSAGTLRYDVRITNQDDETMPCAFGLHPYFAVKDKSRFRVQTAATRAFDNRSKRHVDVVQPIDFTSGEVDLHLVDHWTRHLDFDTDAGPMRVTGSETFRTWVLWTLPERDFVCVEPWTSPGDALNSKKDLIVLSPGERRELRIEIQTPPFPAPSESMRP